MNIRFTDHPQLRCPLVRQDKVGAKNFKSFSIAPDYKNEKGQKAVVLQFQNHLSVQQFLCWRVVEFILA